MTISDKTEIAVDIILPPRWWQRPRYRIRESFTFGDDTVPGGFISDGGTIPRILWSVFPAVNRYFLPTVLHDYKLVNNHGWRQSNIAFEKAMVAINLSPRVTAIFITSVKAYALYRVLFYNDKR